MSYLQKYIKYKNKYLELVDLIGGCKNCGNPKCKDGEFCSGGGGGAKSSGATVVQSKGKKSSTLTSPIECSNCGTSIGPFSICSRCMQVHYCSKDCQTVHWKGGHKKFCVSVEERRPHPNSSGNVEVEAASEAESTDLEDCSICLDKIKESNKILLPCQHVFHIKCIDQLRNFGGNMTCPLCRSDLPPGPEQLFS